MWAKLIGTVGGWMGNHYANTQSQANASKSRQQNFMFGEMAANAADERFRKQYLDFFSPKAQLKQLKEAGLSPSLMYQGGAGGAGGATAPQGGGAGGIQAPYYPTSALEMAQVQNIMAQTEKTKAETETETGSNERGKAEIHKMLQESVNLKTANAYTKAMTAAQNWQNYITSSTADYSIREAAYKSQQAAFDMEKMYWQAARTKQDFEYNQQVFDTRVEAEKQSFVNLQLDALVKKSGMALTSQQIENLKGQLSMLYDESMREWGKLDVQRADQEKRAELIDKEVQNFERKLEQTDKSLRIQNRNSWFNNINSTIRTIAYSASCVASFLPTNSGMPIPPVLEPSGINQYY